MWIFLPEMERTLQVLDCAVLIISGTAGIQGHTVTLWRLLRRYQVPVISLLQQDGYGNSEPGCAACMPSECGTGRGLYRFFVSRQRTAVLRNFPCPDEALMESYLDLRHSFPTRRIAPARSRAGRVFPCLVRLCAAADGCGRASGCDCAGSWTAACAGRPEGFGARVFKIARDEKGARLTFLKVTGGSASTLSRLLRGEGWEEKADQLRRLFRQ